jgi:hypothetical protein
MYRDRDRHISLRFITTQENGASSEKDVISGNSMPTGRCAMSREDCTTVTWLFRRAFDSPSWCSSRMEAGKPCHCGTVPDKSVRSPRYSCVVVDRK